MKQWIATMAAVVVLVGCASTPEEQKPAPITDSKPAATTRDVAPAAKAPSDATARPTQPQTVAIDPLKDPKNILSRRSIYFDYDQFVVKDEFKPVVSAHARHLQQNRNMRMRIEGHADERGSREYNLALGQKRANAVKQMMTLLGASSAQIETISFGEEKPRATDSTEQAWAENRRADIQYSGE